MTHARDIQTGNHRLDTVLILIWLFLLIGSIMDIGQGMTDKDLKKRVEVLEKKISRSALPAPTPKESL